MFDAVGRGGEAIFAVLKFGRRSSAAERRGSRGVVADRWRHCGPPTTRRSGAGRARARSAQRSAARALHRDELLMIRQRFDAAGPSGAASRDAELLRQHPSTVLSVAVAGARTSLQECSAEVCRTRRLAIRSTIGGLCVAQYSFTLGLNPSFSANPPYRSLSFFSFRIYYTDFPDCLLLLPSISVSISASPQLRHWATRQWPEKLGEFGSVSTASDECTRPVIEWLYRRYRQLRSSAFSVR